jgi:hypothetical protein
MFRPITTDKDEYFETIPFNPESNILTYNTTINYDNLTPLLDNDKEKKRITPWLLGIYTSLFLFCEYLQTTAFIANKDHDSLALYTYVYNLLFIWITCYSLLSFQEIIFKDSFSRLQLLIYNCTCHIGGIGFALLGEMKALQNIAITSHFWSHITVSDLLAFILIGGPIVFMMLRETYYACINKTLHNQFREIFIFCTAYGLILAILIMNHATGINYHVHHAICAGILSIYFLDWHSNGLIITHAVLMGVVVEGVNFYGLQEYYLFLTDNSPNIVSLLSFFTFAIFFIIYNSLFCCLFNATKKNDDD